MTLKIALHKLTGFPSIQTLSTGNLHFKEFRPVLTALIKFLPLLPIPVSPMIKNKVYFYFKVQATLLVRLLKSNSLPPLLEPLKATELTMLTVMLSLLLLRPSTANAILFRLVNFSFRQFSFCGTKCSTRHFSGQKLDDQFGRRLLPTYFELGQLWLLDLW